MQTVTSPFAFSIDAGSMTFAPSVVPVVRRDAIAAAATAAIVVVATGAHQATHQRDAAQQRRGVSLPLHCNPPPSWSADRCLRQPLTPHTSARNHPGSGVPLDDGERHPAAFDRISRPAHAAAGRRRAAPLSSSDCVIVVSPAQAAASTSSKPMTDSSSGTRTPAARAASRTPIAWTSELAKMAVGRSSRASSDGAGARPAVAAVRAAQDPARGGAARRRRPAPPRSPRAGGRSSRTRTGSPPRRRRSRSRDGRARAGATPRAGRPRRRRR